MNLSFRFFLQYIYNLPKKRIQSAPLMEITCQIIKKQLTSLILLVYKNKFLVWGKNGDRCFFVNLGVLNSNL